MTHPIEATDQSLAAQLDALRREVAGLRADVASTRPGQPASTVTGEPHREGVQVADGSRDRRAVLRGAALAAAGTVAGGMTLLVAGADTAAAATTLGTGDPGVRGVADPATATGVEGLTFSGRGVHGRAISDGVGVLAESGASHGLMASGGQDGVSAFGDRYGIDATGLQTGGNFTGGLDGIFVQGGQDGVAIGAQRDGIRVIANRYGARFNGLRAPLLLEGDGTDHRADGQQHFAGELTHWISNGIWACVQNGTPGVWRHLAGPDTAGSLHALDVPVRVYDSRPGSPPATGTKTPLIGGTPRTVALSFNGAVPAGAVAALVSLTAANTSTAGFGAIFRNGVSWPGTSNLNWSGPGQQIAVTTLTKLDDQARASLYANVATDIIVDVIGYYL